MVVGLQRFRRLLQALVAIITRQNAFLLNGHRAIKAPRRFRRGVFFGLADGRFIDRPIHRTCRDGSSRKPRESGPRPAAYRRSAVSEPLACLASGLVDVFPRGLQSGLPCYCFQRESTDSTRRLPRWPRSPDSGFPTTGRPQPPISTSTWLGMGSLRRKKWVIPEKPASSAHFDTI